MFRADNKHDEIRAASVLTPISSRLPQKWARFGGRMGNEWATDRQPITLAYIGVNRHI